MRKALILLLLLLLPSSPILAEGCQTVFYNTQNTILLRSIVNAAGANQTGLTPSSFDIDLYEPGEDKVDVSITTCTKANRTITSDATNVSNNDTVTISTPSGWAFSGVYTFKTTLTGAAFEIKIGASAAISLDNLKCAINATGCGGAGTDFGTGTTAHPYVVATTNTDTTQLVEAKLPGTAYNAVTVAEVSTHLSWPSGTLTGGNDNCILEVGSNAWYWLALPTTAFDRYFGTGQVGINYSGILQSWECFEVVAFSSFNLTRGGNVSSGADFWNLDETGITTGIGNRLKTKINDFLTYVTGVIESGTAQAGAANTITLEAGDSGTAEFYRYKRIVIVEGTGVGQTAIITAYNQTTKVANISCEGSSTGAWFTNPSTDSQYRILPRNR